MRRLVTRLSWSRTRLRTESRRLFKNSLSFAPFRVPATWNLIATTLAQRAPRRAPYSHSMVPGGLLVMSKQTRFTPFTSLMIRFDRVSMTS